jgi:ATP-dependent DNA ligase
LNLPIEMPFLPMEAKQVDELPVGEDWQYEPKWDGFRCIVFRDGDEIELQSKSAKPLTRYFPEVVENMRAIAARTFVLDGEIVVPVDGQLSFDELLQRIHPAESRVHKLAAARPALFVAFDMLVTERATPLVDRMLIERRDRLESFAGRYFDPITDIRLSPCTRDIETARNWLTDAKVGFDGVMAKQLEARYMSGERKGMVKIKALRSADCVVGGFRYGTNSKEIGSLLLGLYGEDGRLHHVGFTSSFKRDEKAALTKIVEAIKGGEGFSGRAPGGPSRWSTERSGDWEPVEPKLVVEVQFDHFSEGRFRHGSKMIRWRPDKDPRQCTMDQVLRKTSSSFLDV